MKMINCYLKTLKLQCIFPMIPTSHRSPCLFAAGREIIAITNKLLSLNTSY